MKNVSFLHDLVTAEVYDARTHGRDRQADAISKAIRDYLKYSDSFIERFGIVLAYTHNLTFHWRDGVPDDIRALEEFWRQYKAGIDVGRCFEFYSNNVSNLVMIGKDADYEVEQLTDLELAALEGLAQQGLVRINPGQSGILYKSVLTSPAVKGWERAVVDGFQVWTPPTEWKLLSELTAEERADPKSSNGGKPSALPTSNE